MYLVNPEKILSILSHQLRGYPTKASKPPNVIKIFL
jgi:hypothetical protein